MTEVAGEKNFLKMLAVVAGINRKCYPHNTKDTNFWEAMLNIDEEKSK